MCDSLFASVYTGNFLMGPPVILLLPLLKLISKRHPGTVQATHAFACELELSIKHQLTCLVRGNRGLFDVWQLATHVTDMMGFNFILTVPQHVEKNMVTGSAMTDHSHCLTFDLTFLTLLILTTDNKYSTEGRDRENKCVCHILVFQLFQHRISCFICWL